MAMKAGSETGSLINHVMSSGRGPAPEVGMGVTVLMWSDRYAGTIVKVTRTQVHVQGDWAKRVDDNGMSESQTYEYSPNLGARIEVFRMTKRGYRSHGKGLLIGQRAAYHDYSF